jgi:hypothetical protein
MKSIFFIFLFGLFFQSCKHGISNQEHIGVYLCEGCNSSYSPFFPQSKDTIILTKSQILSPHFGVAEYKLTMDIENRQAIQFKYKSSGYKRSVDFPIYKRGKYVIISLFGDDLVYDKVKPLTFSSKEIALFEKRWR